MRARALPSLAHRLRGQDGFTLIETLIVISILGILAAVVSMSMVGITSLAQSRALQAERMEVQGALNFMVADQGVDPDQACSLYDGPAAGTSDMTEFPSRLPRQPGASEGAQPGGKPVALYPRYVHTRTTVGRYVCTGSGVVEPAP